MPYERHLTTMSHFHQCAQCLDEYRDANDRRYFSQTNSCASCGVHLSLHSRLNGDVVTDNKTMLASLLLAFASGETIAVKGIGGFLLMCDASNKNAIDTLRKRKHRPRKPFAVLFPDAQQVKTCAYANAAALKMLQGETSPIVLLQAKQKCFEELDMHGIAPGLSTIGVMLPYAPLLEWIITKWQKPLVATSGNLSGSSIVFQSAKKDELFQFADHILDHDRDILVPQDDSVVRFAERSGQQIMLRRSRGLAPAMILQSAKTKTGETIFAAGAMLKSAFAIQDNNQIYLSQFLGNLDSYDTQENYRHTFEHFQQLLKARPEIILADLHPDYPSTRFAEEYAERWKAPLKRIQHHEAHFAAILGEHNLFPNRDKILGVIWDGTGLGTDGNIWGGEFFIYENGTMRRAYHLESFPNVAGDKMANEPRLAASAIFNGVEAADTILSEKFSKQESEYYAKVIGHEHLRNTSAGRYFDAVASVLGLVDINSYEGEAALMLEQSAYNYFCNDQLMNAHYFTDEISSPSIPMKNVKQRIIEDIVAGRNIGEISAAFHNTLAMIISKVAIKERVRKVAFSGGVFQNALLVDLVNLQLSKSFELYFH
ncbi:MAG TPA: carbamoyltransferase HypF, partial [Parafilimonas sp.]|nr:carbamoyltransferase HypF [Parafilimonas sp.]